MNFRTRPEDVADYERAFRSVLDELNVQVSEFTRAATLSLAEA